MQAQNETMLRQLHCRQSEGDSIWLGRVLCHRPARTQGGVRTDGTRRGACGLLSRGRSEILLPSFPSGLRCRNLHLLHTAPRHEPARPAHHSAPPQYRRGRPHASPHAASPMAPNPPPPSSLSTAGTAQRHSSRRTSARPSRLPTTSQPSVCCTTLSRRVARDESKPHPYPQCTILHYPLL